jgi:hypothetical protein
VAFLVVLFLLKTTSVFKNKEEYLGTNQQAGLTYGNAIIGDLVNKDTDGDGIPDWEESLRGTDPTKKETTLGIPDSVAIEKLKAQQILGTNGQISPGNQNMENLTQTDKFSRDFLATVTTLSQNGEIDQATADKISSSLADNIQNSPQRKIYKFSDIKIIKNDTFAAVKKYADTLSNIYKKNPTKYTILDILQKFSADENNIDVSILSELDPNIKQINSFINGMVKIEVPQSLVILHLDVLNGFQGIVENLNDIKLYETDALVALRGISKYSQNSARLESAISKLTDVLDQKLKTP